MAERLYRRLATAVLLFGNGCRVLMEFDHATYQHLLALLPDCRKAVARR